MPNLATARAQRFHAYVERLTTALGHRDRHGPLRASVTGLCLAGDRKSIEPMAARVDPRHVRASVPVAYRLYLPEMWAQDRRRRRAAGVPATVEFRTKWRIALEQVTRLAAEGVPAAPVIADAGYGVVTAFRDALTAQAIAYVVGISTETT